MFVVGAPAARSLVDALDVVNVFHIRGDEVATGAYGVIGMALFFPHVGEAFADAGRRLLCHKLYDFVSGAAFQGFVRLANRQLYRGAGRL